jgi:hypothetical protein
MVQRVGDRQLLAKGTGFAPKSRLDHTHHYPSPSAESVIWVLTAAASGVIGNLAYDALKQAIAEARTLHTKLSAPPPSVESDSAADPATAAQEHSDLHDRLVAIAYDVLAKRAQIEDRPLKPTSEIRVYRTETGTWMVSVRELDEPNRTSIEIDLSEDMRSLGRVAPIEDPAGFPIRIWM